MKYIHKSTGREYEVLTLSGKIKCGRYWCPAVIYFKDDDYYTRSVDDFYAKMEVISDE